MIKLNPSNVHLSQFEEFNPNIVAAESVEWIDWRTSVELMRYVGFGPYIKSTPPDDMSCARNQFKLKDNLDILKNH